MSRILVTGGNGFVGSSLVPLLQKRGQDFRLLLRHPTPGPAASPDDGVERRTVGDLTQVTDWGPHLDGIDTVIHLAARVHLLGRQEEGLYRQANTDLTLALAQAAVRAGVRRFVHLSSIKALAEASRPGSALTDDTPAAPLDAYGRSKRAAEQGLQTLAAGTGMVCISLRPPLVYGPGVRANFLSLLRLVDRGLPLPLGGIRNRRSLISVANLADAIVTAATRPAALSGTWLVADQPSLSTPDLVRAMALALGRPARLLPVPHSLFAVGSRLPVLAGLFSRLSGSLEVDDSRFRRAFAWSSPVPIAAALTDTAAWYRAMRRGGGEAA